VSDEGGDRCPSGEAQPASADGAFRCVCGSLLARRVPGGVELKCRRCKRVLVIPLDVEDAEL